MAIGGTSAMCVIETSTAGRDYKVKDMAQADFGKRPSRTDSGLPSEKKSEPWRRR
jgi:hypothetical protein